MTQFHCIECAASVRPEAAFCHECGASSANAIHGSGDPRSKRVGRLVLAFAATLTASLVIGVIPWGGVAHIVELVGILVLIGITAVLLVRSWQEVRPLMLVPPWWLAATTTVIGTGLAFAWMIPILALLEVMGAVMLDANMEGWPLSVSLLMIGVIIPIEEEILFRGVVQNDLERLVPSGHGESAQATSASVASPRKKRAVTTQAGRPVGLVPSHR